MSDSKSTTEEHEHQEDSGVRGTPSSINFGSRNGMLGSFYLMQISIIQGVALGLLITNAMGSLNDLAKMTEPPLALRLSFIGTSLLVLITVSFLYSYFINLMNHSATVPHLLDSLLPILLGVAQVLPTYFFTNPRMWWVLIACFLAFSILPLWRTRSVVGSMIPYLGKEIVELTLVETHRNIKIAVATVFVALLAIIWALFVPTKFTSVSWMIYAMHLTFIWILIGMLLFKSSKYVQKVADLSSASSED